MNKEAISTQAGKLHHCILIILKEIMRVCEKNNIQYFLIGGTLLGAVRHKGFIPWDDDLDIGLLRCEYNRFLECCEQDLDEKFKLCTFENEKLYGMPFAKVKLKGTFFAEKSPPKSLSNEIYVDVFPIDKFPTGTFQKKIHRSSSAVLHSALLQKCGYNIESSKRLIPTLFTRSASLLPKTVIVYLCKKCHEFYNNKSTEYYANFCSSYQYGKEIFPSDSFLGELKKIEFEGMMLPVPNSPGKILTLLYGDYMQLPPEDKRVFRHAVSDIKFGDYC